MEQQSIFNDSPDLIPTAENFATHSLNNFDADALRRNIINERTPQEWIDICVRHTSFPILQAILTSHKDFASLEFETSQEYHSFADELKEEEAMTPESITFMMLTSQICAALVRSDQHIQMPDRVRGYVSFLAQYGRKMYVVTKSEEDGTPQATHFIHLFPGYVDTYVSFGGILDIPAVTQISEELGNKPVSNVATLRELYYVKAEGAPYFKYLRDALNFYGMATPFMKGTPLPSTSEDYDLIERIKKTQVVNGRKMTLQDAYVDAGLGPGMFTVITKDQQDKHLPGMLGYSTVTITPERFDLVLRHCQKHHWISYFCDSLIRVYRWILEFDIPMSLIKDLAIAFDNAELLQSIEDYGKSFRIGLLEITTLMQIFGMPQDIPIDDNGIIRYIETISYHDEEGNLIINKEALRNSTALMNDRYTFHKGSGNFLFGNNPNLKVIHQYDVAEMNLLSPANIFHFIEEDVLYVCDTDALDEIISGTNPITGDRVSSTTVKTAEEKEGYIKRNHLISGAIDVDELCEGVLYPSMVLNTKM